MTSATGSGSAPGSGSTAGSGSAAGSARFDAIVIGAGHNGLVCATLLARSGRSVLVLEAAPSVGGAAVTREFAPGFRVSAGAHLIHLMSDELRRELRLAEFGLDWAGTHLPTTALLTGEPPLPVTEGGVAGGEGGRDGGIDGRGAGWSAGDRVAYQRYSERMRRYARALAPMFASTPPRLGTDAWVDRLALLRLGWQLRRLRRSDMRDLLRIGGMNVFDLLEENFESPALKGALAFDAVLGTNFGPRSPGTVLTLLYRLAGESGATGTGLAQPRGGVGAVSEALASAARAAGATIRTASPVAHIVVETDRANGVVLASGERYLAGAVISSADPRTTFLKLLGARHLDTGFVRRIDHFRSRGLAAKLHLALDAVPRFTGLDARRATGRLLIAPSLQHVEQAFNHAKYGEFSSAPIMEISIPTMLDPGLAPSGCHVVSAIVQYAPYALQSGWEQGRQRFLELCIATLETYAPGLTRSISSAELLTPADIETEFRIHGGHWHHGELAFDQFFMVRPVPGAAQHATPVAGLFLCGAGCHPGGGVMGVAGRNAARQILRQAA